MHLRKIRLAIFFTCIIFICSCNSNSPSSNTKEDSLTKSQQQSQQVNNGGLQLDTVEYNRLMNYLANAPMRFEYKLP